MLTRVSFFPSHLERFRQCQKTSRLQAHFRAACLAAPMVVTVWSSVADFQVLAMRLAAKMFLPGTVWVALKLFMDLVGLMMDLSGKRYLSRESLALFYFQTIKAVWDVTISHLGVKASLLYTVAFRYRISANSFRGNYSFLEVRLRPLFKGGNYSFILVFVYNFFSALE